MSKAQEVKEILRKQEITSWFQPIIDIETRELLGWEAFSRGPITGELKTTPSLFDSAAEAGVLKPFDLMCLHSAANCFEQLQLQKRLFVHLSNEMLVASGRLKERIANLISDSAVPATRMVLEIDERSAIQNIEAWIESSRLFHELGFQIAIDDLDLSALTHGIWCELKPHFVKIDRRYVADIHNNLTNQRFVQQIVTVARSLNARVIGEGVETLDEYRMLKSLGVQCVQGYLIQKPELSPEAPNLERILPDEDDLGRRAYLACDLVSHRESVTKNTLIKDVLKLFEDKVYLSSIAVLDKHKVVGMVHRHAFLAKVATRQRREVLQDMPVKAEMDSDFLSVDSHIRCEQVSRLVIARARIHGEHDFVITACDKFLGIGTTIELLRKLTQSKLGVSRQSDLLTMLPGTIAVGDCVEELLQANKSFTIALLDLTDFKPYNNHYGHCRGDELLVMFAEMLRKHISQEVGFLGHIGGDDFVVVLRNGDWNKIIASIMLEFSHRVVDLYNEKDRARGGIQSTDRFGETCFFPFLSISGGVAVIQDEYYTSFQALLTELIKLKQRTKRLPNLNLAVLQAEQVGLYAYEQGQLRAVEDQDAPPQASSELKNS